MDQCGDRNLRDRVGGSSGMDQWGDRNLRDHVCGTGEARYDGVLLRRCDTAGLLHLNKVLQDGSVLLHKGNELWWHSSYRRICGGARGSLLKSGHVILDGPRVGPSAALQVAVHESVMLL